MLSSQRVCVCVCVCVCKFIYLLHICGRQRPTGRSMPSCRSLWRFSDSWIPSTIYSPSAVSPSARSLWKFPNLRKIPSTIYFPSAASSSARFYYRFFPSSSMMFPSFSMFPWHHTFYSYTHVLNKAMKKNALSEVRISGKVDSTFLLLYPFFHVYFQRLLVTRRDTEWFDKTSVSI